jgi:protein-tyrosine phosphatase
MSTVSVLFVCMGNICRSPAAEAIFRAKAAQRNVLSRFSIDSCGTGGWHAGERADARMRATAKRRGIEISSRARQITDQCLTKYDHIICMDMDNLRNVQAMGGDARVQLMLAYASVGRRRNVPDPYYGENDGFSLVLDLLDDACEGLLDVLLKDD